MSHVLNILLIALITFYLYLAPFTKVEESFNIQAIYDMINNGYEDLSGYDHNEFPGVVKRTFVGALFLATITKFLKATAHNLFSHFDELFTKTQLDQQFLVRFTLGLLNGLSLIKLKNSVSKACSKRSSSIGFWFGIFQFTQFHSIYYASRTLPNFFALPLVNLALSNVVLGDIDMGLIILAFTSTVFRIEIVAFTGILFIVCVINRQTTLLGGIKSLIVGGVIGLILTGFVDSYFWQTEGYIFPEIESFIYNVIEGKSSNWGTEPFTAYFVKYIPQIFNFSIVPLLAIPGLFFDLVNYRVNTIRSVVITSFLYVSVMSIQPHKELRFIIYAVPGITMAAATTIAKLSSKSDFITTIFKLVCIGVALLTLVVSLFKGYISSLNYPGGVALQNLNKRLIELDNPRFSMGIHDDIIVHLDVPACMTGASLFGQIDSNSLSHITVKYDKTEDIQKLVYNDYQIWHSFNYVITDFDVDEHANVDQLLFEKLAPIPMCEWVKIDVTEGYSGINKKVIIDLAKEVILKDPVHFAYLMLQDIKSLKFKVTKEILNDIVIKEPKLYTYENVCY